MNVLRPSFRLLALSVLLATVASGAGSSPAVAGTDRTLRVQVAGSATGPTERVVFTGQARITSTLVTDPDFGAPPSVVLVVDLTGIPGTGAQSRQTYAISGPTIMQRPLAGADPIDFTFAFWSGGEISTVATGRATCMLTFDGNGIRTATVTITDP